MEIIFAEIKMSFSHFKNVRKRKRPKEPTVPEPSSSEPPAKAFALQSVCSLSLERHMSEAVLEPINDETSPTVAPTSSPAVYAFTKKNRWET